MKNLNVAAVCALAFAFTGGMSVSAQAPRQDGRWEISTEMDMPGMPVKMPVQKTTTCVTKEDATDPQKALPQGTQGRGANSCKVSDYKTVGSTVTWAMKCEGAQPMTGTGEIVYGDGTYNGTMKMDMGGGQTMTMKYSGKRLGDCTK